jgi:hypothetical protein
MKKHLSLFTRSSLFRSYGLGLLILLAVVFVVAYPHLFGQVVFIGDADRLNTFLNIKLAEVIGLKELGEISAWNPNSFMGFNLLGLYWTLPGWQFDSYLHALFPIESFFRNAGYVTFFLLLLSMSSAYAYLYDLTNRRLASLAGACCYGLSSLSLGRLAQVDTAYYSIVLMPLAMLAVRCLVSARWAAWGVVLALCIAIILGMSFLQEAAYILLLLGAYCLYIAITRRRWAPILVFFFAFLAALLLSAPRLLGVAEEFSLMFRTTNQSGTGTMEILRLFHDGIFGRYFEEAWGAMSNQGYNPHEGLQLYSSTVATCMLVFLGLIVDIRRHIIPLAALYSVFAIIAYNLYSWNIKLFWLPGLAIFASFIFWTAVKIRRLRNLPSIFSLNPNGDLTFHILGFPTGICLIVPLALLGGVFIIIAYVAYVWNVKLFWLPGLLVFMGFLSWAIIIWRKMGYRHSNISINPNGDLTLHSLSLKVPHSFMSWVANGWRKIGHRPPIISLNSNGDATFHILAVSVVLAFVLVPAARNMLYLIFFKVDFLHARIVVDALLPFSAIIALTLAGFANLAESSSIQFKRIYMYPAVFIIGLITIGIIHYSVFYWQNSLPITELKFSAKSLISMNLSKAIFLQVLLTMGVFCIGLLFFLKGVLSNRAALIIYVALSSAVIADCVIYAHEKLFGDHTRTFPIAFSGHNYFNAPGDAFTVPSAECRNQLGLALESNNYRSVSLGDPKKYYAFTGPHLSQFWQIRLLDGYPGLPKRLAMLPWVPGIVDLRSLAFRGPQELPWELLSLLGVKYAIPVTENLYYNQQKNIALPADCAGLEIKLLKNPYSVIPRQFFAGQVIPFKDNGTWSSFSAIDTSLIGSGQVELSWWLALRDGDIEVQLRSEDEADYRTIGRLTPMSMARFPVGGLSAGKSYFFRLHKLQTSDKPSVYSDPARFQMPLVEKEAPKITKISSIYRNHISVTWPKAIDESIMRIEIRRGIDGVFTPIADVPASKGVAEITLIEPVKNNAIRIQLLMNGSVSPHSEPVLLSSVANQYSTLIERFFANDAKYTALVEGSVPSGLYFGEGSINASYRGDNARFDFIPSTKKRFLVINEMFHPRWTAKVDGVAASIYPTNYVMLGIPIPAGAKTVELGFNPVLKSFGAKISFTLGILIILTLVFIAFWHRFNKKISTKR